MYHFTFSNKLAKFLFPIPANLGSASLEIFVLNGGMLPVCYTAIALLNCELGPQSATLSLHANTVTGKVEDFVIGSGNLSIFLIEV